MSAHWATWMVLLKDGGLVEVKAPHALLSSQGALCFREPSPDKGKDPGQLLLSFAHGEWRRCQMRDDLYGNPLLPKPAVPL